MMEEIKVNKSSRSIYFSGELTIDNSTDIVEGLLDLESEEDRDSINFYINSFGGSAHGFLAVYDVIQGLRCEVNTIGMGACMSAGAFLLMSGTGSRKAYKNTRLLIHELQCGVRYDSFTNNKIRHEEHERLNRIIIDITNKQTGKDIEGIKDDFDRDLYLNTTEAVNYGSIGIIDEVI